MKIVIEIDENSISNSQALSPLYTFNALRKQYVKKVQKDNNVKLYACMEHYCERIARELYAQRKGSVQYGAKTLILTYKDAEQCFEIFKELVDAWVLIYEKHVREEVDRRGILW